MNDQPAREAKPPRPAAPPGPDHGYIPAITSILERRPRTLKRGDTFAVFDHYGNVTSGDAGAEGLYHKDTRYLSNLRILVNGQRPLLLSSTVQDNNAVLKADLTNPDFIASGSLVLPKDTIHIARSKFLWAAACHERLGIRNFSNEAQSLQLAFFYGADFADIFEVRGARRAQRGRVRTQLRPDGISFIYEGLDGIDRRLVVRFDPVPAHVDAEGAVIDIKVPPGGRTSVFVTMGCHEGLAEPDHPHFFVCLRRARRAHRKATRRGAAIDSSNAIFNEVLARTKSDLNMLTTETEHGPFPYAGIPWFSTAFGRDAIITAMEMLWADPAIAKGVLGYLAQTQATETDPAAAAEPGKILHETRAGEMAHRGEVPFARYYGSVDATALFVMLAGMYFERTGDRHTTEQLWPNVQAALGWIEGAGDADGDGFVEYPRHLGEGLVNQGWKDSADSVFHADGRDAEGAIALCEVQGYAYAARLQAAKIAIGLGLTEEASRLMDDAKRLRQRFEAEFWCEEIGTYAMALDGDKRQCKVRSSNAGHLLFAGIAAPARARQVADQLMGRDFYSGFGIRTIAASEVRYNPMSYHNGSIWPHDNALIGLGFARYGFRPQLLRLFSGMFDAAGYMDLRRLPELFCGFHRTPGSGPTFYPVACSPQAWSCAAPYALLQASLGLELDFSANHASFRQPRLPGFLNEVNIRSLAVGNSRLDILLHRHGAEVAVNVPWRDGEARVDVAL
jgi:glycogen debranching enzyme